MFNLELCLVVLYVGIEACNIFSSWSNLDSSVASKNYLFEVVGQ